MADEILSYLAMTQVAKDSVVFGDADEDEFFKMK